MSARKEQVKYGMITCTRNTVLHCPRSLPSHLPADLYSIAHPHHILDDETCQRTARFITLGASSLFSSRLPTNGVNCAILLRCVSGNYGPIPPKLYSLRILDSPIITSTFQPQSPTPTKTVSIHGIRLVFFMGLSGRPFTGVPNSCQEPRLRANHVQLRARFYTDWVLVKL